MKKIFIILFLSVVWGYSLGQRGTKLNITAVNQEGKSVPGLIFTATEVQQSELITDNQGKFTLLTPYDLVDVYTDIRLVLHSNDWAIATSVVSPEVQPDPASNSATVTLEGRKKGVITLTLEPKSSVVPVRTADLTPEQTVSHGVQVASLTKANPEAQKYYQTLLQMKVEIAYKNGKILYYIPADNEKDARIIEKNIEMKKVKNLEDVFIVAIEKPKPTLNSSTFRIQIAASEHPLSQKEIQEMNAKLKKLNIVTEENISGSGKYNFKYFTNQYFGSEQKASEAKEKILKAGIQANIVNIL